MAIIGNDTELSAVTLNNDDSYLHNLSGNHRAITVAEEAFKYWLWNGSSANNGVTAEVGLYDITAGTNNATLVGAVQDLVGTGSQEWLSVDITGSEVSLEVDKTYAVGMWAPSWVADVSGGYESSSNIKQSNTGGLPSTFVLDSSLATGAIAMYIETQLATSALTITSVNSGSSIADGATGVVYVGTEFALSGNTVTISPTDDINDTNAVVQTVTTEGSTTSLETTTDLPTGSSSDNPVFVFVNNGTSTTDGFSVDVTAIDTTPLVLELTHNGNPVSVDGTLVVCQSALGFNIGMSVTAYRSATSETPEPATSITWVDVGNTAEPQLVATFPNGDLVSGDTYKYSYDDTVGDIQAETGGQPLASFTDKDGTVC